MARAERLMPDRPPLAQFQAMVRFLYLVGQKHFPAPFVGRREVKAGERQTVDFGWDIDDRYLVISFLHDGQIECRRVGPASDQDAREGWACNKRPHVIPAPVVGQSTDERRNVDKLVDWLLFGEDPPTMTQSDAVAADAA